ncbi:subunit 17 of mediator complex-domain-containing protein [Dichotomocladium elegans]|nr:subunit 17 of mediator complex-domain-containing protein [Dichotomocladium elegans]
MELPPAKRIKLSLEPSIESVPTDITDLGEEIFKNDAPLPTRLMEKVDRIWFERGEWRNITEESLERSIAVTDDESSSESIEKDTTQPVVSQAPGFDLAKVRDSVTNKLFHAKSEIDVALDVINILLAQTRSKDVVLPLQPGTLHATYVTRPKPTLKAQAESVQLTLGLKRKQQKNASEFLKSSAAKLRALVQGERSFWEEALDLRRNNWLMQANSTANGTSFLVRYGYSDAGSDFSEASSAEFSRADDDSDESTQLTLPHSFMRMTVANVSMTVPSVIILSCIAPSIPLTISPQLSKIQRKLAEAQSTIFDSELYTAVLSEAQILANSNDVRFNEDEVIVTIDGHVDLSIRRVDGTLLSNGTSTSTTASGATKHIAGRTLDHALRLLLIQRYRLNIWKNRARLLCPNRKVQLLLASMGSAQTQLAAATGANGSVASVSNSAANRRSSPVQNSAKQSLIPILPHALTMCKFWVLFDRVRQLVYDVIEPFSGEGGAALAVHYEMDSLTPRKRANGSICDSYPGVGEMSISLSINIMKGQFLLFVLHESGNITVRLPQGLVTLSNISEFQALLTREINLICLRRVCDVANDYIRRTYSFKNASASEQARSLWKVDDIEETINGSIRWAVDPPENQGSDHVWRSM